MTEPVDAAFIAEFKAEIARAAAAIRDRDAANDNAPPPPRSWWRRWLDGWKMTYTPTSGDTSTRMLWREGDM